MSLQWNVSSKRNTVMRTIITTSRSPCDYQHRTIIGRIRWRLDQSSRLKMTKCGRYKLETPEPIAINHDALDLKQNLLKTYSTYLVKLRKIRSRPCDCCYANFYRSRDCRAYRPGRLTFAGYNVCFSAGPDFHQRHIIRNWETLGFCVDTTRVVF